MKSLTPITTPTKLIVNKISTQQELKERIRYWYDLLRYDYKKYRKLVIRQIKQFLWNNLDNPSKRKRRALLTAFMEQHPDIGMALYRHPTNTGKPQRRKRKTWRQKSSGAKATSSY